MLFVDSEYNCAISSSCRKRTTSRSTAVKQPQLLAKQKFIGKQHSKEVILFLLLLCVVVGCSCSCFFKKRSIPLFFANVFQIWMIHHAMTILPIMPIMDKKYSNSFEIPWNHQQSIDEFYQKYKTQQIEVLLCFFHDCSIQFSGLVCLDRCFHGISVYNLVSIQVFNFLIYNNVPLPVNIV